MKQFRSMPALIVAAFVCLMLVVAPAIAQQQKPRVSPHDVTSASIEGKRVAVYYGRPYRKDPKSGETRKIWGGLVPYGKVWRLGANEATLLVTQADITIGETAVPAGAYSLYLILQEDGSATLIINKKVGQWGTEYDEASDLARIQLLTTELDQPVDQFTMTVSKATETAPAGLKLAWDNKAFSTTIAVKK